MPVRLHPDQGGPPFSDRGLRFGRNLFLYAPLCLFSSLIVSPLLAEPVNYSRDVEPILATYCVDCHSPDGAESGLMLDSMLHALRGGDSGEQAISPGHSTESYLIRRVTTENEADRMPPESDPLSADEISVLRRWIDQKEAWQPVQEVLAQSKKVDHWSFQPVSRPEVPQSDHENPIDAFVDAKRSATGLTATETAPRRRLIRRLYMVMHGLPPTPQQVERFLADERPNAWELLVDEVLASPRYGERYATHWFDLVRFGETHGFETNRERPHAWRYRDWVINALNDDKPYNQFIIEQIAGDAIDADVATGFLVGGPYDIVKGANPELQMMQRQDELADMVNTTGTAFLGLTLGCARCHNHKFDPVSQTDYYAMQAVFAGVNHADRSLPMPENQAEKLATVEREMAELEGQLQKFVKRAENQDAESAKRAPVNAKRNTETFGPAEAKFVRMTIDGTNSGQPCIDELEIYAGTRNIALASEGAVPSSSGDFEHPLHKLEHINDGQHGNPRSWISAQATGGWVQIELPEAYPVDRIVWGRDREGQFADRLATNYQFEVSLDGRQWQVVASSVDRIPFGSAEQPTVEYQFKDFPEQEAKQGQAWLARFQELAQQQKILSQPPLAYAGTFSQPAPTHRLYRGEPGMPREQVAPAAITAISDLRLPADSPEQNRRMEIAQWIADPENPLTPRVMVNRLWQYHFGIGIIDTPSDFGGNGTQPTHPELLDWLASEFIERDWSIKQMHRLILTSKAWLQDSRPNAEALAIDGDSRMLWRFPPRRIEAEGIRDSILSVTGKLDLKVGGPGFSAFRVEAENVRHYHPKTNFGAEDWRRMIYMTKVRQERDAVFGVFDCPDGNQVTPKRSQSTTPLQALNLLNSRFVLQQAGFFAERLEHEAKTPAEKVALAYELCYSRPAEADEIEAALAFVDQTDWQQFARAMLNTSEFLFIP